MSYIVSLTGSASASDQSSAVLEASRRILRRKGFHSDAIVVRNLPWAHILHGKTESSVLEATHCLIERAQAIVIMAPLPEAVSFGLLKTYFDTLPPNALLDKPVLPIVTGGSSAPLLSSDYALKSVLAALGASSVLESLTIADIQVQFEHGGVVRLEDDAEAQLRESLDELTRLVSLASPASFAGKNLEAGQFYRI